MENVELIGVLVHVLDVLLLIDGKLAFANSGALWNWFVVVEFLCFLMFSKAFDYSNLFGHWENLAHLKFISGILVLIGEIIGQRLEVCPSPVQSSMSEVHAEYHKGWCWLTSIH